MRILALNGASGRDGAGLGLLDGAPVLQRWIDGQGAAVGLPAALASALDQAGWTARSLELIAVLVGPGSFTGLRASLALAHGLALGGGAELIGVTVGEAMAPALRNAANGALAWCVSQARRDRVFIEAIDANGGVAAPTACMLDALPAVEGPLLVAGDVGALVADLLRARGDTVALGATRPDAAAIAAAALRRRAGGLAPLPAQPLYVDAPEAKLPVARLPATGVPAR